MDRLSSLAYFVRTAELGSFVRAGQALGLSASAVGKGITRLEEQLGVRLFHRTTRSLQMTSEGRVYFERCRRILQDLDEADALLSHVSETPRGRLRVSLPAASHILFEAAIIAFVRRYPDIDLDLDFSDRLVNLIDEDVDIAIRTGELPDSRLMRRALPSLQLILCASPAYLARHGVPQSPRELEGHCGIRFRYVNTGKLQAWPLRDLSELADVRTRTVFSSNNMEMVRSAIINGLGVGAVPDFMIEPQLASGVVQPLLGEYLKAPGQFQMVWTSGKQLSSKIRVFVDFISDFVTRQRQNGVHGAAAR